MTVVPTMIRYTNAFFSLPTKDWRIHTGGIAGSDAPMIEPGETRSFPSDVTVQMHKLVPPDADGRQGAWAYYLPKPSNVHDSNIHPLLAAGLSNILWFKKVASDHVVFGTYYSIGATILVKEHSGLTREARPGEVILYETGSDDSPTVNPRLPIYHAYRMRVLNESGEGFQNFYFNEPFYGSDVTLFPEPSVNADLYNGTNVIFPKHPSTSYLEASAKNILIKIGVPVSNGNTAILVTLK